MMKRQVQFQSGFTMIEVLVTIVILLVGLLGLASLQSRATVAEMEAYQRSQALGLLRQMESVVRAARTQDLTANPPVVASQFSSSSWSSTDGSVVFGTGNNAYTAGCAALTMPEREVCDWNMALQGAAELHAGSSSGAMIGARGCIISVNPVSVANAVAEFYIVVVWQGLSATADPQEGTPGARCASAANYGAGLRRAVVSRVLVPTLTGP
jgi:type IV pilus assembly protein PilV